MASSWQRGTLTTLTTLRVVPIAPALLWLAQRAEEIMLWESSPYPTERGFHHVDMKTGTHCQAR